MAKLSMMLAVLFAAALLAPRPVAATEQDDVAAKLKAFEGVDHFAAEPDGSYKGVADPKLHAKLNGMVDSASASLAAGIRKRKSDPDQMQQVRWRLWQVNPKDLDPQDANRVTKEFGQLLSLAGLAQYDRILIQWLYNYEAHKPKKEVQTLSDFSAGG